MSDQINSSESIEARYNRTLAEEISKAKKLIKELTFIEMVVAKDGSLKKITPHDAFDDNCHKDPIKKDDETPVPQDKNRPKQENLRIYGDLIIERMNDEDYEVKDDDVMFLINLAEHVKRPKDMLMFIGEYFKQMISITEKVNENITENSENSIK